MLKEKEVTEDEMVGWHCQLNGHKYMHKLWETVKDREAWHASVHEVTKSWTWLSDWTAILNFKFKLTTHIPIAHYTHLNILSREGNGTPLQYSCLENPMDGGAWWAAVHGVARSWTRLKDFTFTFHFHALEKEMATHSGVLAWRIPGTGEPGGLPSMGSQRVGHNWSDLAVAANILSYINKICCCSCLVT